MRKMQWTCVLMGLSLSLCGCGGLSSSSRSGSTPAPSGLSYATPSATYAVGAVITANTPASSGGLVQCGSDTSVGFEPEQHVGGDQWNSDGCHAASELHGDRVQRGWQHECHAERYGEQWRSGYSVRRDIHHRRGDNGRWQPNYSTMGGDLAAAALSNAYYPPSNRGVGLFLSNFLIDTGQRATANLAQEFILRRLTKVRTQQQLLQVNQWQDLPAQAVHRRSVDALDAFARFAAH